MPISETSEEASASAAPAAPILIEPLQDAAMDMFVHLDFSRARLKKASPRPPIANGCHKGALAVVDVEARIRRAQQYSVPASS